MSSQVDFYLIKEADNNGQLDFTCRLIEKAHLRGHRIFVQCPDQQTAHNLDERLWTFNKESFIPHNLLGEGPNAPPPVQIGYEQLPKHHNDILLNLCNESPENAIRFRRICEIIPQNEEAKLAARERYKLYRQHGCQMQTHDLGAR